MRTDLDHLPSQKQRELERVVQLVFEEFEDSFALARREWKKQGRILKILLYGSYARGGWVDEPHTAKGYKSDYDLLIIVNDARLTDRVKYWSRLDERLMREYGVAGSLKTPVNFIVHTLGEVNDGLAHGRYFFIDVARDGIALYQADEEELHQPKPKTPEQAVAMARQYFEEWYPSAIKRFNIAKFDVEQGYLKDAAFDLHQATERLYHCILLTMTFYTPHVHNLGFLRTQAERLDRSSSMPGRRTTASNGQCSRSSRKRTSRPGIRSTTGYPAKNWRGSQHRSRSSAGSYTRFVPSASPNSRRRSPARRPEARFMQSPFTGI